jgi:hypothetical protein
MELPVIMQWLKQTFAQRYNALTGRTGHIWGDRYWSEILEGEPPAAVGAEAALGAGAENGVKPCSRKRGRGPRFSAVSPAPRPPRPAKGADTALSRAKSCLHASGKSFQGEDPS